ncbi:hypothetical protein ACFSTH_17160 [Paenibacillus yanchengensis]|uniref:Mannosyl-glycoprotein endo-beta-N-acetylglucosamidase-like domain-containing protein n=1 Tax=Paenibacillus yanchengensis TaxID=2035833 RepID=A0ABW4YQ44_9BACL
MSNGSAYLFTAHQLKQIRLYVQQKYKHQSDSKHAEIVANTVQQILYRQLPDFPEPIKQQLLLHLIERIVVQQQRFVTSSDIDTLCRKSLDLSSEEIAVPLSDWRKNNANTSAENLELKEGSNRAPGTATIFTRLQQMLRSLSHRYGKVIMYSSLSVLLIAALYSYSSWEKNKKVTATDGAALHPPAHVNMEMDTSAVASHNELPIHLQYIDRDWEVLRSYLETKQSYLADDPYFSTVVDVAKQFDIHPVLLFAITGQEQGFVPKSNNNAATIANNPFNVFHSWQDFNTNITESTEIAARTITRLSKEKPDKVDPIVWINREYAEDPNWASGVNTIFSTIIAYMDK